MFERVDINIVVLSMTLIFIVTTLSVAKMPLVHSYLTETRHIRIKL